jgi:hypothetical protein
MRPPSRRKDVFFLLLDAAVPWVLAPVTDEDSILPLPALLLLKADGPPSRSRLLKLLAFRAPETALLVLRFLPRPDLLVARVRMAGSEVILAPSRSMFQPSLPPSVYPRRDKPLVELAEGDSGRPLRVRLTDLARFRFCRPLPLPRPADLERPPVDWAEGDERTARVIREEGVRLLDL